MLTHLALFFLRLLARLPPRVTAALGDAVGDVLFRVAKERRHITLTNLRLCFPDLGERERRELARSHFRMFARALLDRAYAWHWPAQRLRDWVSISGLERLNAAGDRPAILLAPHFVGVDVGWTRLALERDMVGIYSNQKDPVFNAALLAGRLRFGDQRAYSRQDGVRSPVRALREGRPFFYQPDMDYGRLNAIFVPFFGVPAATITGLSRIARATDARVFPCVTEMRPGGAGYAVTIGEPLADFPGESVEADTLAMNQVIERLIRPRPEQYFWAHKRFKTRPEGEAGLY